MVVTSATLPAVVATAGAARRSRLARRWRPFVALLTALPVGRVVRVVSAADNQTTMPRNQQGYST
jgi:hypothetical protein